MDYCNSFSLPIYLITLICSYAFDPLEYSLGLITHDRRIKPQGWAFKELVEAYRGKTVTPGIAALPAPPTPHTMDSTWDWLDAWLEGI